LKWEVDVRVQNLVRKTCFGSFLEAKDFINMGKFQRGLPLLPPLLIFMMKK
jgi:hypothetical protein